MRGDLVRTCAACGSAFTVTYRSQRTRFCGRSCANRTTARARTGAQNSNWHGGCTAHPLYAMYHDMVARCTRPSHPAYSRYGGRGITVAARWQKDFWAFVADVGERPAGLSIDRINNDGPYAPGNTRWATQSQQSRNRRTSGWERRTRTADGRFA